MRCHDDIGRAIDDDDAAAAGAAGGGSRRFGVLHVLREHPLGPLLELFGVAEHWRPYQARWLVES